jgi:hypothetical protein
MKREHQTVCKVLFGPFYHQVIGSSQANQLALVFHLEEHA